MFSYTKLSILLIMIVLLIWVPWEDLYGNYLYVLLLLGAAEIIRVIYRNYMYKTYGSKTYLLMPTKRDHWQKWAGWMISIGCIVAVCYAMFVLGRSGINWYTGLFFAIIFMISNFFYLPKGKISVKKGSLKFDVGGWISKIKLEDVFSVEIKQDTIVVRDRKQKEYYVIDLNLDRNYYEQIKSFLTNQLGEKITIH